MEVPGPSGGGAAGSGSSDSVGRQPQRCYGRTLDDPGPLHAPRQQPSPHPARIKPVSRAIRSAKADGSAVSRPTSLNMCCNTS